MPTPCSGRDHAAIYGVLDMTPLPEDNSPALIDLGSASVETKGIAVGQPEDLGGMRPLTADADD